MRRRAEHRSPGRVSVFATLAGLIVVLSGACSEGGDRREQPPVPVTVAAARRDTIPYEIHATGAVEAAERVAVRSQVDGVLMRVHFDEGDDVRAGQILFEIDARPYRAALQQAQAVLARDQAQLANAEAEVKRYEELVAKQYVTPQQFDQVRTNAAALRATVQAGRAAVDAARLDVQNATIRAPITGRAGNLLVHQGNLVQANGDSLVVINQVDPVLVRFTLPAVNLPLIRRYAGDSLAVSARSASAEATAVGVLSFVDNAVDSGSGTILLKAEFPNADGALWPGDFVDVALELYQDEDAVLAPARAVVQGQQGSYVFVVDGGTATQRDVVVNRTIGDLVVIEQGLSGGESVVTEGQLRLTSGAKVQVQTVPADARDATRDQRGRAADAVGRAS